MSDLPVRPRTVVPWVYPAERAAGLRSLRDALIDLLEALNREGALPHQKVSPTVTALVFWRTIVVGMVKADVHHTGGELVMVQELFDDGSDLRDNDDWLRKERVRQSDIEALSRYVAAARALDERVGGGWTKRIRDIVCGILGLAARSDYQVSREEAAFGRGVLETLELVEAL